MRRVAFGGAAVAIAIAACNVLTGVNDFSTLDCEDCERRECATDFEACIASGPCANFTHCLTQCASPPCACPPPADEAGVTGRLEACAQTLCTVCAAASAPGPRDAAAE